MAALVPELVNMASDPNVSTGDLLRRALVVAKRLAVPDLTEWINAELNGYTGKLPEYRKIRGQIKAMNPINGPIPVMLPTAAETEKYSLAHVAQSIPELAKLAREGNAGVDFGLPPAIAHKLMSGMSYPMRPFIRLSSTQLHAIVELVRNRVLDWALDLEERGVVGEGMTFTPQEKQAVSEQHFHFGDVSGSQIQIGSHGASQTQTNATAGVNLEALQGLIAALAGVIDKGQVQGETAAELRAELATLKAQAESPKPKWEVIKATARSIKTVAEGAAGGILAELAKPHMATLLALAAGAAGS